jgi:hypothetical protein
MDKHLKNQESEHEKGVNSEVIPSENAS